MFAIARTARRRGLAASAAAALVLAGCATPQPVVYQKTAASAAQQQRVAKDTQDCRRLAQAAVGLIARRADAAAQSTVRTGAIAFAATAVGGLVNASKDDWQRARAGAAGGATGAAVKTFLEWNDPDEVQREYVERCMEERGHDVLGWRRLGAVAVARLHRRSHACPCITASGDLGVESQPRWCRTRPP